MRRNLVLLLVALLALLALLEVSARFWSRTPPNLLRLDPTIGRSYVPGFEGEVYVPEAGRSVHLRFNREGFRGPDLSLEKPAGVRRLALLGDSFVAAIATEEENTLVRRLEARLDAWDPAHDWQVMNFGVSAASTGQELALYRQVVAGYRPDLVVCAFSVLNDFADNSRRWSNAPRIYFDLDEDGRLEPQPPSKAGGQIANWLNRHSTFYRWQKNAQAVARERLRVASEEFKPGRWIFSTRETADIAHGWALLSELIVNFAAEVEATGSTFALVVLPSAEQVYDDLWREMVEPAGEGGDHFDPDYPERRLAEIAARAGAHFLGLRAPFRAAAPRSSSRHVEEWLYYDGRGHFNDRGNELVAGEVFAWITGPPTLGELADQGGDSGSISTPRSE